MDGSGSRTDEHEVVIAGGGPTGLMLAAELALAGVDVGVVERRETQELSGARAGGLHSRTIEILDQRGVADRFLAEGQVAQVAGFASVRLDLSDFPTPHPYGLGLWQNDIERILAGWVGELDVAFHRGREVIGFAGDEEGVEVELAEGGSLRARYLVGCDGGRSVVRKRAGVDFPGWEATTSSLIAEAEFAEEPELGIFTNELGVHSFGKLEYEIRDGEVVFKDGGPVRVMVTERAVGTGEPTLADLREALIAAHGTDYGIHDPTWVSRFTDMTRQAAAYREGRILLAGDAAHVHSPIGGQGLNIGIHDAVNLGWKLARVIHGASPPELLDSYHAERHPAGARVLRTTMAQSALSRPAPRIDALRETVAELLEMEEPRRHLAGLMSGLDVRYDLGEGHPLLGRRVPDLEFEVEGDRRRLFTLLHDARPLLLDLGGDAGTEVDLEAAGVRCVEARYEGAWELPVLGEVSAPASVLVRPDGHVAWVGEGDEAGLREAVARWFGGGVGAAV